MKTLTDLCESLLDSDFDITEKDLTPIEGGWYIERASANEYMMTTANKNRIAEITGLKCNQISGDSPWSEFDKIGNDNTIKCTCRNRWNNLKYVFAHWLIAFMKTARPDEKSINDTIYDLMSETCRQDMEHVTVKNRGGKLFIKGEWTFKCYAYRGHKASISITLHQK